MAFTIQFVREFTGLGFTVRLVVYWHLLCQESSAQLLLQWWQQAGSGRHLQLSWELCRSLSKPTRYGVLGTQLVDYLVTPRVLACIVALPILTLLCFAVGLASSAFLADTIFGVSINIILDSARRALRPWDVISAMIKSQVFGAVISVVSCAWGVTTHGGAKGVGESTTSAVVSSLVLEFSLPILHCLICSSKVPATHSSLPWVRNHLVLLINM